MKSFCKLECEKMRDACVEKCGEVGLSNSKKCFVKCHLYNGELFQSASSLGASGQRTTGPFGFVPMLQNY